MEEGGPSFEKNFSETCRHVIHTVGISLSLLFLQLVSFSFLLQQTHVHPRGLPRGFRPLTHPEDKGCLQAQRDLPGLEGHQ